MNLTSFLFAIFTAAALIMGVIAMLSFIEAGQHKQRAQIQPYRAWEHLKFAELCMNDYINFLVFCLVFVFLAIITAVFL